MQIRIKNKTHLQSAARKFLDYAANKRIFAFYGSMGAGKTTFIKCVCKVLGAVDIVSSPTFTLINEYSTDKGEALYHIDFYRIKKCEEVFDFGIEEYFSSGSYCFIEWPEMVEEILPEETVKVRITVEDNEERFLVILN
jgi:tRNA threonylcarbamoyladenosine biosynthesis protein TsaE